MIIANLLALAVLLDTPTPSPTPAPTPTDTTIPVARQPISVFPVDQDAALPWPIPQLPTLPAGTPVPTLYNATAGHATDYPNALGTATSQVGALVGPVNALSTPISAFAQMGPTSTGGDIDTGLDPNNGGSSVTLYGFATDTGALIGTVWGGVKGIVISFQNIATTFPIVGIVIDILLVALAVGAIIRLIALVMKSGIGMLNLVQKVLTVVGVWKPG